MFVGTASHRLVFCLCSVGRPRPAEAPPVRRPVRHYRQWWELSVREEPARWHMVWHLRVLGELNACMKEEGSSVTPVGPRLTPTHGAALRPALRRFPRNGVLML